MADLPSVFLKQNDIENATDAPLTEALMTKQGSNDNYLKDTQDSQESRIITLETPNVIKTTTGNGSTTSIGAISTAAITPAGTNVMIIPSGEISVSQFNTAVIQIRRGATVLSQINLTFAGGSGGEYYITGAGSLAVLDTGATSAASNSYSIYVSALGGGGTPTVSYTNLAIGVVDIK